jgi:hypothetical protein
MIPARRAKQEKGSRNTVNELRPNGLASLPGWAFQVACYCLLLFLGRIFYVLLWFGLPFALETGRDLARNSQKPSKAAKLLPEDEANT